MPDRSEHSNPRERASARIVVVVPRREAVALAWVASIALVLVAVWFGGRVVATGEVEVDDRPAVLGSSGEGATVADASEPEPSGDAVAGSAAAPPSPAPSLPASPDRKLVPKPTPQPAPRPETEPVRIPEPTEVVLDPAPAETNALDAGDAFERASSFVDAGDLANARAEAQGLLSDHGDYSGLIDAFRDSGAGEVRAMLDALRVLQLAGLDAIATDVARELKSVYPDSPEVREALRDWRIFKPRVASLETSIDGPDAVLVRGEIENPDIGAVRRVVVDLEALDAAGITIAATTVRVRPRKLDPGEAGSFTARFAGVDSAAVLSVRATVSKWESEVVD